MDDLYVQANMFDCFIKVQPHHTIFWLISKGFWICSTGKLNGFVFMFSNFPFNFDTIFNFSLYNSHQKKKGCQPILKRRFNSTFNIRFLCSHNTIVDKSELKNCMENQMENKIASCDHTFRNVGRWQVEAGRIKIIHLWHNNKNI